MHDGGFLLMAATADSRLCLITGTHRHSLEKAQLLRSERPQFRWFKENSRVTECNRKKRHFHEVDIQRFLL